ncbi:cAMP-binding domain of CRP or a regulatory subunit of cAMP-dependent protein kinases [Salinibacillus kushneri]|uniref:cAMP-binding domain of CRP or a regulatory subunit of cAMP-dependent protein kinases n=1 Tax=Salinibacillus kushneri TaxID=237682 RepID=A0A1H9ZFS2_9BACI|nr:Crp/Fnr family transcriptional regulator [Salinibacillus kushneri]SES80384.1 cAMP-binding domain of CRP or a regulatory subunit of cAMP-dependent protein kinases [Salinibacillus kushneri]
MENLIKLIEEYDHLYEMVKECPYRFLKKMSVYHFKQEEMVIHQGDAIHRFYIIVEGTAKIYVMSENGRTYSQAIYQKGDFIGEIEIFDQYLSVSNVKALTDLTLIGIDGNDFLEWMRIDNHMSYYFNRSLAKYLYNLAMKSGVDSLYPLKYRLCDYILKEMVPYQRNQYIVRISKNQMSEHLAVTLRSINRVLKELAGKKIIKLRDNGIIVSNIQLLNDEKAKSMLE